MSTAQTLLFFGIIALTTVFTRALAFVIFPEHKETPRYIQYLGKALPYTIIGLLVVYCLKEVSITVSPSACRRPSRWRRWPVCICGEKICC